MRRGGKKKGQDTDETYDKACWGPSTTRVFLNCVIKQMALGNRPFTTLTEAGYNGARAEFKKETGRSHSRIQMKNKYDDLKHDWIAWEFLRDPSRGTTGVGYDAVKGTYVMEEKQWNAYATTVKNIKKFQFEGLEHEDLMQQVFAGIAATGAQAWTPSSDFNLDLNDVYVPETGQEGIGNTIHENECEGPYNNEFVGFNASEQTTPPNAAGTSQSSGKKRSSEGMSTRKQPNKRSNTGAGKLSSAVDRLTQVVEAQGTDFTCKPHGPSVAECFNKLNSLPGLSEGVPLYLFAANQFVNPMSREVFMGFGSDQVRLAWLEMNYKQSGFSEPAYG